MLRYVLKKKLIRKYKNTKLKTQNEVKKTLDVELIKSIMAKIDIKPPEWAKKYETKKKNL